MYIFTIIVETYQNVFLLALKHHMNILYFYIQAEIRALVYIGLPISP